MRKEHTYTVDGLINGGGGGGLYPGGLISRIIYSLANGWAYIWGGGLKSGILRYFILSLSGVDTGTYMSINLLGLKNAY